MLGLTLQDRRSFFFFLPVTSFPIILFFHVLSPAPNFPQCDLRMGLQGPLNRFIFFLSQDTCEITQPCFDLCPTFGWFKTSCSFAPYTVFIEKKVKPTGSWLTQTKDHFIVEAKWKRAECALWEIKFPHGNHGNIGLEGPEDQLGKSHGKFCWTVEVSANANIFLSLVSFSSSSGNKRFLFVILCCCGEMYLERSHLNSGTDFLVTRSDGGKDVDGEALCSGSRSSEVQVEYYVQALFWWGRK